MKKFLAGLICAILVLSIGNMIPSAIAVQQAGTTTQLIQAEVLCLILIFGSDYVNSRHLEGDLYCLADPSNCTIVH